MKSALDPSQRARQAMVAARRAFAHVPDSYDGRFGLEQSLDALDLIVDRVAALTLVLDKATDRPRSTTLDRGARAPRGA